MLIKLLKVPKAIWKNVRSFNQLILLIEMLLWSLLIKFLKPILSLKKLFNLVIPRKTRKNESAETVLLYMKWFDYFHIFQSDGDCLIQAMILYRYLFITGEKPKMLIGFKGKKGHAWVEISGNTISPVSGCSDDNTVWVKLLE